MNDIEVSLQGGVATITLNRPHRKNAFTFDMLRQWADFIDEAQSDNDVRVVVGAGNAFCAGVDLDDFATERNTPWRTSGC
jgi:enoyl-CoA hydratase/carnithine racemase